MTVLERKMREAAFIHARSLYTKPTDADVDLVLNCMLHGGNIATEIMRDEIIKEIETGHRELDKKRARDAAEAAKNRKIFEKSANKPNMGKWSQNASQKALAAKKGKEDTAENAAPVEEPEND